MCVRVRPYAAQRDSKGRSDTVPDREQIAPWVRQMGTEEDEKLLGQRGAWGEKALGLVGR